MSDDFGIKPAALKAGAWNGEWAAVDDDGEEVSQITAIDATSGVLRMTEPGKKDDKPVDFEIRLASQDGKEHLLFALVTGQKDKDKEPSGQPTPHLIRADDGVLLVWSPNHEAIAKSIQSGQLMGRPGWPKKTRRTIWPLKPQTTSRCWNHSSGTGRSRAY